MIEKFLTLLATEQPIFFLLAGPNGAGKSTFRRQYLNPAEFPCIDPDEVARNLFGRDPKNRDESRSATVEASRQVIERFQSRTSFGLETVFSDTKGLKLELLKECRRFGYRAGVIFVGLDDSQLSIARVMDRIDNGGHDVPDDLIVERFPRSFQNLKKAIPLSDFVLLVDNSGESRHRIFGMITTKGSAEIWDTPPRWYDRLK